MTKESKTLARFVIGAVALVCFVLALTVVARGESKIPPVPEFGDVVFMATQKTCPGEPPAHFALLCHDINCGRYQWWDMDADKPFLIGDVDPNGVGQLWVDMNRDGAMDKYYTNFAELLKEYPNLCDHRTDSLANQPI